MAKNVKNKDDKFYTKPKIAIELIKMINLNDYDIIIEPSAGDGSFSNNINHNNLIALDILPENENIIKMDWFDFFIKKQGKLLVIGNPPFGIQSNMAVKFIRKACEIGADTIAFILPKSFKKNSLKNKIPLNYHLINEVELNDNSFLLDGKNYDVPAVFQIWERSNINREKKDLRKNSDIISFVKKNENPDYSFRRVGFYAGNISDDITDKSEQSHYFIKSSNDVKTFLMNFKWSHNNTSGPRSIGKSEIINILDDFFKKNLEV